jgi:hypothetical protein
MSAMKSNRTSGSLTGCSIPAGTPAERIIARNREQRLVIEEFRPLAESLEWRLGQRSFWDRGSAAFTSDAIPVPYIVNNDGTLSSKAAKLLVDSLAAEEAGRGNPRHFS